MKTFVNSYFENCYTSGSIEGNSKLGRFIGIVFDDTRAYNSGNSNRGKAVFRNCYSTSSVGMQYSGSNVGGFAGLIVGNIQAAEATSDSRQHVFENCYAAGEVGGITTDTSTGDDNTNSIGGFMGSYVNYKSEAAGNNPSVSEIISIKEQNNSLSIVNCYYDKQTTAMRERDVGNYNYNDKTDNTFQLNDTLDGLEGVYTKKSVAKNIEGLTDDVFVYGK